jgi:predicted 2-oxoglutarate/Fe(II)-dependent dioxygenase YbiX
MFDLKDYILVVDNILPVEYCQSLLSEYKDSAEWKNTKIKNGEVDQHIRSATSILMSTDEVIDINKDTRKQLDTEMFSYAGNAIKKYIDKFPFAQIEHDSGYELLRYEEGQFYSQHTDSFNLQPRAISCSFALNDDYEGGDFAFFDRQITYRLNKGSAILFPSNFMYPHEILPVTKGTRYSIVTWFL